MLDISIECRKGVFFIRLNGILNNETVFKLKEDVLNIIQINGIKYIVFNFENLCYIDELGIKYLKKIYNSITNNYGKMYICNIKSSLIKNKLLNCELLKNIKEINNELSILKQI